DFQRDQRDSVEAAAVSTRGGADRSAPHSSRRELPGRRAGAVPLFHVPRAGTILPKRWTVQLEYTKRHGTHRTGGSAMPQRNSRGAADPRCAARAGAMVFGKRRGAGQPANRGSDIWMVAGKIRKRPVRDWAADPGQRHFT